ncbi:MAG: ABC transporter ATP-binding protein [Rhodoblastus sp.]
MLAVAGLACHYGRIAALHGVDITVAPGELVALVGANGAGKTTLLRAISGIIKTTAGSIRFGGQDITHLRAHRRMTLGICQAPEGRQVFGPLSVEDNLRLGAFGRSDRSGVSEDIERMYAMFPVLGERADSSEGSLSGGQQQMLAMARALMGRPRLLLLDEPSLGLAPLLVEQIFEAIVSLRRQSMTILLVEQNAHAALAIADRAYVIETGAIALSGAGEELLHNDKVREAYLGM